MIVRTSEAGAPGFNLLENDMVERSKRPYALLRKDLRACLKYRVRRINYTLADWPYVLHAWIEHGKSQRNKKFIGIGCMRFVGENRTKLIKWAKGGK